MKVTGESDINRFLIFFFNLTAAVKREDDRHIERKSQRELKKRRSGHKRTMKGII